MTDRGDKLQGPLDPFSPEEEMAIERQLSAYCTEPLQPSREELLDYFDGLLETIIGAELPVAKARVEDFFTQISRLLNLAAGTEVQIEKAMSLTVCQEDTSPKWEVFYDGIRLMGKFSGLAVMPWYDISLYEEQENLAVYRRPYGLFVALEEAHAIEDIELIDIGSIYVPLNHGLPKLYRVLRAPE